jgi:hypothetical protein
MRTPKVLVAVALAAALTLTGGGPAWAGSLPGSGDDDGTDHHADHHGRCPAASVAPGPGPILSLPRPGAPGPLPPLPTSGAPEPPDRDPFYRAPGGFAACAPGTVLRSRVVGVLGLTSLTGSIAARQLLFRSTSARGRPIVAVTTLLTPTVPAPGPARLVSYQAFEDSFTTGCAPSYTLRTNSGLGQPAENGVVAALLAAGWAVSVPDHEGPRSLLAVGPEAGRITLDSIRAVESLGPGGARTPVGLMGYSGGSTPTLWANALARDYAPELNIVGSAAGGVIADLGGIMRAHGEPPIFGGVLAVGVSLDRAYPDFDFYPLLTDRGRAAADRIARDATGCIGVLTAAPLDSVTTDTHHPDMDSLLAVPRVARTVAKVNLVTGPNLRTPSLIYQGIQDELVPVRQVDDLVAVNRRSGAQVDYQRVPGEHVTTFAPYAAHALTFLRDRFAGAPA